MSQAQYLLNVPDKGSVELSLDLIRKGIQREDTSRILEVLGPDVTIEGTEARSRDLVAQDIERVFASSSKRQRVTGKKALSSAGTNLNDSNLWDFDILSPRITIQGDSAFVECELVLWEAEASDQAEYGSKIDETLVFWCHTEEQSQRAPAGNPRRWKLVGCRNLLSFLTSYGNTTDKSAKSGGATK